MVTERENVGENACSILYSIKLFEKYEQYKKKFGAKKFYFTSRDQILSKSMYLVKSWKFPMHIYIFNQ